MVSHRKPLEGKHWTVKRTAFMFPASSACLCKLCIINVVITEFDHWMLNFERFVALFMIEILPRVLNMDCKWPKLAFCSGIPLFYYFERWYKYSRLGNRWKIDTLVQRSMDVLPSRSSSRSRDWKLSIEWKVTEAESYLAFLDIVISLILIKAMS